MRIIVDNVVLNDQQAIALTAACTILCVDMEKHVSAEDHQKDPVHANLLTDPEALLNFITQQFAHDEYTRFMTAFHWYKTKLDDAVNNQLEKMMSMQLWEKTDDAKRHMDAVADSLCQFIEVAGNLLQSARRIPSKTSRDKVRRAVKHVDNLKKERTGP